MVLVTQNKAIIERSGPLTWHRLISQEPSPTAGTRLPASLFHCAAHENTNLISIHPSFQATRLSPPCVPTGLRSMDAGTTSRPELRYIVSTGLRLPAVESQCKCNYGPAMISWPSKERG
ncbi:hypothetical protein LIA77_10579 [Sarocladium implicatum]|nr:hypothetical protein LIA77_10579 [Sarocladium implicatum]